MSNRITKAMLESALAGDYSSLKAIPKGDRHAHMVLSAPFETFRHLSHGKAKPPPARFASLKDFLNYLEAELLPLLSSAEAVRTILADTLDHMIADGVTYTEMSFDFRLALGTKTSWKELVSGWREEIALRSEKIKVSSEFGLSRETDLSVWKSEFPAAVATGFFDGIDLYGDELARPIEAFNDFFAEARKAKLRIKIHSGEIGDAARVFHELKYVNPEGIQHGVLAAHDPKVLAELARRAIPVNVCPWSNIYLSVAESYETHPIRKMVEAGVRVTVGTDDLTVFGRSLSEEYAMLYIQGVLTPDQLEHLRQNSLIPGHPNT